MHSIEFKTPSGIVLFAQVMEPLAMEPLVVLVSASPIVGELLGEKRITLCHSATGVTMCRMLATLTGCASGPRRQSLRVVSAGRIEAQHRHACRVAIVTSARSVMGTDSR